jgi:hypothetical protein
MRAKGKFVGLFITIDPDEPGIVKKAGYRDLDRVV